MEKHRALRGIKDRSLYGVKPWDLDKTCKEVFGGLTIITLSCLVIIAYSWFHLKGYL